MAAYYERERVPFDPEVGFDPERVIQRAPRWATLHGIAPPGLRQIEGAIWSSDPNTRSLAQGRLAELHAMLGSYERAVALDRRQLVQAPRSVPVHQRLVWSLLHQGRREESLDAAEALESVASDALSRVLVASARHLAGLPEAERAAQVARLPLLTARDAPRFGSTFLAGEVRTR